MTDIRVRAARYIGVPFKDKGRDPAGWDCWGLLRYVRADMGLGQSPSYAEAYDSAHGDVAAAIEAHLGNWNRLSAPRPGSALLFRRFGVAYHVGFCVSRSEMLHVSRDLIGGTTIERFDTIVWGRLLDGAYWPKGKEELCKPL